MKKYHFYFSLAAMLLLSVYSLAVTRAQLDALVLDLKSDDDKRCSLAAIKLADYGPEAKAVIPSLIEIISGNKFVFYASTVLSYIIAEEPIENLFLLTQDKNSLVQSAAIACLKQRDIDKEDAIKIYTNLLDDDNPFVQLEAVDALTKLGAGKLCFDTVIRLASHEDATVESIEITQIGEIGITTDPVKQILMDSFSSPDKRNAIKAILIFQKLYPDEKQDFNLINSFLKDEDKIVRWHAVRAVGNLKNVDPQIIQLAKELMHDNESVVVVHACYAMIRHNIETEQAWGRLTTLLESKDYQDKMFSLLVLRELVP
jgi:HEAT repeat protein